MGYAGGISKNPTYYDIGDHSETVQVDYNPAIVSYQKLLQAFWSGHSPTYPAYSRQYRSAIFYADEEQKKAAIESIQQEKSKLGQEVYTDIEPLVHFYLAENYHQKYYLREAWDLMAEISAIYPEPLSFLNSTVVARVNGYLAGYGNQETLEEDINKLGLSESGKQRLLKIAAGGLTPGCPVPKP